MPRLTKTASAERLRFVEPMYARAVQQLPAGKDWLYEEKFDGYRFLAGRDSTGITLWSRRGNRFTDEFPTVTGFRRWDMQLIFFNNGDCRLFLLLALNTWSHFRLYFNRGNAVFGHT
jgi:hypothetical protein